MSDKITDIAPRLKSQIWTIWDQLKRIQTELKAPKNQKNNYGGYMYRSCEDILEAVKPLLARYNVCLTLNDEIVQVGDRYYVQATASLYNEVGDCISNKAYAREALSRKGMDESQITGASSSYARKYALSGLLAIDDNKDADAIEQKKDAIEPKRGTEDALKALEEATSLESLKEVFAKLPIEVRTEEEVINKCKELAKGL